MEPRQLVLKAFKTSNLLCFFYGLITAISVSAFGNRDLVLIWKHFGVCLGGFI